MRIETFIPKDHVGTNFLQVYIGLPLSHGDIKIGKVVKSAWKQEGLVLTYEIDKEHIEKFKQLMGGT